MSSGWEGILENGETVLWQGRPDGRMGITKTAIPPAIAGAFFATVGISGAVRHMNEMGFGIFTLIPILFAGVGLRLVVENLLGWWIRHKYVVYTLTNRRAFIATDYPFIGRKLASYPIQKDTKIRWVDGPVPSIFFTNKRNRSKKNGRIGFVRIADADNVLQMMRDIQKDAV